MKFRFDTINITKDLLLQHNSQETYLNYYLGIPVKKGLFVSPLRNDKRPTCAFYRNSKDDIIFKDFGSDFSGNFIAVVMEKYQCSYYKALRIIANDFGIVDIPKLEKTEKEIVIYNENFNETKEAIIQVEIKEYSKSELEWWKQFGITEKTLKKFRVFSCATVFLNGKVFLYASKTRPIFAYYRGKNSNDTELWRIYMPMHKKRDPKFLSNWKSSMIQGSKQLPKEGDLCVITKSLKDCMSLYELGITAIAPNSETLFVTDKQLEKLKQRFKKIVVFYDNDRAGKYNMAKIRKKHPELDFFLIPKKFKCKDVSDLIQKYGFENIRELYKEYEKKLEIGLIG